MNIKSILFSTLALTTLAVSTASFAQDSADGNGVIKASIRRPITVDAQRDLDFGVVFAGSPAQVAPTDAIKSAEFKVTGEPLKSLIIALPTTDVIITKGGAAATGDSTQELTINNFQRLGGDALDVDGNATFTVGADLNDNETDQASGSYNGSFIVTVIQSQ